jgi:hypothetical protein
VSAHRTIPEFISFSLATVNFGGLHLPGISRCGALSGIPFRVTPASTPLGATGNLALTGYQALMVAFLVRVVGVGGPAETPVATPMAHSCAAARRATGFAPVPACSLPEDVKG